MIPSLIAFGFANLAALGWLAAAAAPILIHLWMRQTRRETSWAAIRFLQKALERQARKLRLQHLILLLVRTAILVLVALAAAKPFFESGLLAGAGSTPTHRVLVFDASLSMGYADEDGTTRLAAARRIARALVSGAAAGDVFSVVAMGAEPTTLLGPPAVAGPAVERAIERVEPTHAAADLGKAIAHVTALLEQNAAPASVGREREALFFTDLDERGWSAVATRGAAREAYGRLAEMAATTAVDVGVESAENASVTRVALDDDAPTSGRPVLVLAEATRFGGERTESVAQLIVDGQQVAEQTVSLAPDRATPIEFTHTFAAPGRHAVSVKLDGDALAADDRGWLAVDLRERIRVLCVAGSRGAARYVVDALDPLEGEASDTCPYEPLVVSDADLGSVDFSDFQCVFFCNVAELSHDEASRLSRYLDAGGGVVFFLGDRVDAQRYNDVLGGAGTTPGRTKVFSPPEESGGVRVRYASYDKQAASPILRTTIGQPVTSRSYGVDPLDYAHPIAAPFRGRERGGLLTTPVTRYFKITLPESDGAGPVVALALGNGAPLLVTDDVRGGRVALVSTAASLGSVDPATGEPWTAMPAWPSFLPIVRGLVQHVALGAVGNGGLVAGEPASGRVDSTNASPAPLRVERPDESEMGVPVSAGGAWSYSATDRIGLYRFFAAERPAPVSVVAVNADPAESRLRRVATDTLPDELRIERRASYGGAEGVRVEPASIHRWLLQAALALVLVDTALACWFGRGGGV